MTLPRFIPHPASWASAVALFLYAHAVTVAMMVALPILFELMRLSPRLAWLGILGLWVSPIAVAALVHRATSGLLDFVDVERRSGTKPSGASSVWAGFLAWMTILAVSTITGLLMLVLDPPPVEPDSILRVFTHVTSVGEGVVRTLVWIALAAQVYELERNVRGSPLDL